MNFYLLSFFLGVIVTFLCCKNFYLLRKNQNAHIFSKMLYNAIRNIGNLHDDKQGDKLRKAIKDELVPCLDFIRTNEDFLPTNMKKWFQKSVENHVRSHDYLNRYKSIKIDKDSATPNLMCNGEKSFQYLTLMDLVINLLYAKDRYQWEKLFYPRFYDTS